MKLYALTANLLVVLSALFWSVGTVGAEAPKELGHIEVRAEAVQETVVKESPSFVTVIKPSESQGRLRDVGELLSESAGVQVRRLGGIGSPATVSIRGSSSDQVEILLDGIPLNRAASGAVDLSVLPVSDVERIEVYRGTVPVQYGVGAIGGLINIVTKRAKSKRSGSLELAYGSFDTWDARGFYAQQWDKMSFTGFATYEKSAGDFEYRTDNGTPTNPNDDRDVRRQNNRFESTNVFGNVGYDVTEDLHLELSNDFLYKDAGVPGTNRTSTRESSVQTARNISYLKLDKRRLGGTDVSLESKAYFIYQKEHFEDPLGEVGVGRQDNDNRTRALGINGLFSCPFGDWNVGSLFLEARHETFRSENLLEGAQDRGNDPQTRLTLTTGLSDDVYLFGDRLTVSPLVFLTYYRNDFEGKLPFSFFPNVDNHSDDLLTDAKIGGRYRLTDTFSLKANVGRFNRIPTFTELFGDRGGIVGNPDLKPEMGYNADLGFIYERRNLGVLDRAYVELAGFCSLVDDVIVFVQNSQRTFRAENVSSARIIGLETSWSLGLFHHLILSGSLTWQNPEDTSDDSPYHGNRLPGRAEFELFQRTEFAFSRYRIFHELNVLTGNYIDRSNLRSFDDRVLHNAGVVVSLCRDDQLSLSFEVKNLTDEDAEDIEGYPLPGRAYYGKATWKF